MTRPACTAQACDQGQETLPLPRGLPDPDDHGRDDMVFNKCGLIALGGYLLVLVGVAVLVYVRVMA